MVQVSQQFSVMRMKGKYGTEGKLGYENNNWATGVKQKTRARLLMIIKILVGVTKCIESNSVDVKIWRVFVDMHIRKVTLSVAFC